VPSAFALRRLETLGAPLGGRASVIPSVQREFAERSRAADGEYALYAGRLTVEKGAADAIAACRLAGVPLVVAGDGPEAAALRAAAGVGSDPAASPAATERTVPLVRFTGRVGTDELAELRAGAALALVPSRYEEILPLAALEAMAEGLPVVASSTGGLIELVPERGLHPPGDIDAMASRIRALWRNTAAGDEALTVARERTAPGVVAAALRGVYERTMPQPSR
jgi:glycosyltransferase involved in cell wall biosynthesis